MEEAGTAQTDDFRDRLTRELQGHLDVSFALGINYVMTVAKVLKMAAEKKQAPVMVGYLECYCCALDDIERIVLEHYPDFKQMASTVMPKKEKEHE